MMVPELDEGGSCPGCGVVLRFVMRDMGNGVHRLEEPGIIQNGWREPADVMSRAARFCAPLPPAVLDLAQTALLVMKDKALGYVLAAPIRGFAVFMSEGVTQVTLKLACVMDLAGTGALVLVG